MLGTILGIACVLVWKQGRASVPKFLGPTAVGFGLVTNPTTPLKADFRIANESDAPLVLSGFEDACGLKAECTANGIVMPHKSATLTLVTTAGRTLGYQNQSFLLKFTRAKRQWTKLYTLSWTMGGKPALSSAEIWIKPGDPHEHQIPWLVQPPRQDARIASLPKGVDAQLGERGLRLSASPSSTTASGKLGDIIIECSGFEDKRVITVPVFVRDVASQVRLYPSIAYFIRNSSHQAHPRVRIVGTLPPGTVVACSSGTVTAKILNGYVELSAAHLPYPKEVQIDLKHPDGGIIASALVRCE